MTASAFNQSKWIQSLVEEAKRDVVFVFNIVAGAFGGPPRESLPDHPSELVENIAEALLNAGCDVGFGKVGSDELVVPEQLRVPRELLAKAIGCYYAEKPEEAKFLLFYFGNLKGRI